MNSGRPDRTSRVSVAEEIVAALRLPGRNQSRSPALLPLRSLATAVIDTTFSYSIGKVDSSGRVSARGLMRSLGWRDRDSVSFRVLEDTLLVSRTPDGAHRVHDTRFVVIPLLARQAIGLTLESTVLLAAAPVHDVLAIHNKASLDAMVVDHFRRIGQGAR